MQAELDRCLAAQAEHAASPLLAAGTARWYLVMMGWADWEVEKTLIIGESCASTPGSSRL